MIKKSIDIWLDIFLAIYIVFMAGLLVMCIVSVASNKKPEETMPPTEPLKLMAATTPIEEDPDVPLYLVTPIVQSSTEATPMPTETQPEPTEPEVSYYDVPLSEDLQDYIFTLCKEHDIDPALVIAMIKCESSYKARAVGDNGNSLGLMQIQPRWHQKRMDRLNCPDLLDPYQNVTVGIDILSDYFDTGKPVEWVLMAYNGGRAYANRKLEAGEVSTYATKVLAYKDELAVKQEEVE